MTGALLVSAVAACVVSLAAPQTVNAASSPGPVARYPWHQRIVHARKVVPQRQGRIGFAIVNERGVSIGGYHANEYFRSASVVKAMMLVCYLNKSSVRGRRLQQWERGLLAPMVRRSSDSHANRVWGLISTRCLYGLARQARMTGFTTNSVWGTTRITPAGTARLFYRIDRMVARRHRPYARQLLRTVVPSQRWGIARTVPRGFTIFFKGGFVGPNGGRIINQGALLENGNRRLAIAILTDRNPSHEYGTTTLRLIATRLLRRYARYT